MPIEVEKVTAPAQWAAYLINGDASGFDYYDTPSDDAGTRDREVCDAWCAELAKDGWRVTSVEGEPHFAQDNDAGTLACDVLRYTLVRELRAPALDDDRILRHVLTDDHRLLLWDTLKQDSLGKCLLGYALYAPGDDDPIFVGADFACSPMRAIDSDAALRSLLTFLTLKPGDTDADYFDNYTPRQISWCNQYAEELSFYAIDPEPGEESPAFIDV